MEKRCVLLLTVFYVLIFNELKGQVVINEIVTDPKTDWSTNGFDGTDGGGAITSGAGGTDEWIELYINTSGLNLTGWTIELLDGSDVVGDLTDTGAFDVSRYISSNNGLFTNTQAGDYLVLGNVDGQGQMSNSITVILKNSRGAIVDQVTLGGEYPNAQSGRADSPANESMSRMGNGKDTNIDGDDFYKTRPTLGTTNSPEGIVLINEVVTHPQHDWSGSDFFSPPASGTVSHGVDEFVELYVATSGMNLTGYTIELLDGTDVIGSLEEGGAFQISNYVSHGNGEFSLTEAGDYLVLGNVIGNEQMNNNVHILLKDASGNVVDELSLNQNGVPSGKSTGRANESVSRYPNGVSEPMVSGFMKTLATPGSNNTPTPISGSGYALDFDGNNDYVITEVNPIQGITEITIEFWLKSALSSGSGVLYSVEGIYFATAYSDGSVALVFDTIETILSAGFDDGKWHHLAVTNDGNTTSVFVDGVNVGSYLESMFDIDLVSRPMSIGAQFNGTNPFKGQLDEMRIWNKSLSQLTIQKWMCKKVTSEHSEYTNLLSYYKFDGSLKTILIDHSGNKNGVLTNMNPSTDWVLSGAVVGDDAMCVSDATTTSSVALSHTNGDQLTATVSSGAASLMCVYRVDQQPVDFTPPEGFDQLSEIDYFGVKLFGSSSGIYTVEYNYSGHPGIVEEEHLAFASRENNALPWELSEHVVLDTFANTLSLTNQTGTEFILGSIINNPLPIELLSFEAEVTKKGVQLSWVTASEHNNNYFTIEKSREGMFWTPLTKIDGAEKSFEKRFYDTTDDSPYFGVSYYRLRQTDIDGKFSFSPIRSVDFFSMQKDAFIYPNPTFNQVTIQVNDFVEWEGMHVQTMTGLEVTQDVFIHIKGESEVLLDLSLLAPGMYVVKTRYFALKINKR